MLYNILITEICCTLYREMMTPTITMIDTTTIHTGVVIILMTMALDLKTTTKLARQV